MFVQIHMLQSMPPGNLNRDETGQPKKCLFGGVTRGRISSQCLKRNIRQSTQFKEAFGDSLASRTTYLPQMVADALGEGKLGVPADELNELMLAIAAYFKKEKTAADDSEDSATDGEEKESKASAPVAGGDTGKTGQLVFFPQPYARRVAELIADLRTRNPNAYARFIDRKVTPKPDKDGEKVLKAAIERFTQDVAEASKKLTVDIGLFGRMTTSNLVINVEAACQVAHAISTHETLIESDFFTAMDDEKAKYAQTQTDLAGAAFVANESYFSSAVYYKYLNLDVDAIRKHLPSMSIKDVAHAAGVLVRAAALATPTGKQNSFASHSFPELVLVEVSKVKRPVSYANAFLQAVEGATGKNLMGESAKALSCYIDSVAAAFAPADVARVRLAVGPAKVPMQSAHKSADTLDQLADSVSSLIEAGVKA